MCMETISLFIHTLFGLLFVAHWMLEFIVKLDMSKVHRCPRPMAFAHVAVSFGSTPSMIQFPNPGLCINYFVCDHIPDL